MIGGVVRTFQTGTYTVTRSGAGSYTLGRFVAATATTFCIDASIQPVNGRDLQVLAESRHGDEVRVVYTLTELFAGSALNAPDLVTIGGEPWEVFRVESWPNHWRAYVSRKVVP